MALTDKNIVITPNIGQSADPSIVFSGADAATTAQNITVRVYPTHNGTLSFEGTQGQLFSINNNFTGTIFSVNDISGIPSIEVLDTGEIKLAQYSGVVRVLSSTSATSTSTGALQISGGVGIGGNTYIGGNLNVAGLITGNVALTGTISTATNINGGTAGQLHYQSAPGLTAFAGPGTAGQILVSAGASAPLYTNTGSIYVGNSLVSNSLLGGTVGQLPYQIGANATSFIGPGTAGQILVSAGAAAPVYTNTASIYVNSSVFAEDIRGGAAGQLLYQSAANATGYVGPGVAGQVLVSNGSSAPVYQNTLTLSGTTIATSTNSGALIVTGGVGVGGSLYVGGTLYASVSGSITTATNIAAGTAGQIPYQTAPGLTSFIATVTNIGGVLVNNGGAAPTFNNVLTLLGTTQATSTLTGALQVRGGAGIGGNLYVGGSIFAGNLTGSISTATNLSGGIAGNIPIQTGPGVTGFITNGTAGQVLVSSGTGASWGSYTAPVSVEATTATHLALGTANQIPYQSGTGRTTWSANFTYNGTNFTVGTGNATANAFVPAGSTVPTNGLYLPAANSIGLATNSTARLTVSPTGTITSTGDVRINSVLQSSSTATGALVVAGGVGVAGNLWVGGTIYGANLGAVSTATHLAVGTTNQIPYQSALGRTTWSANFQYNGTDLTIGSGKVNAYSFVPTSSSLPANGLYLPAVNSVGLATNSTNRLTIDSAGNSAFSGNVTAPNLTTTQGVSDATNGLRLLNPGGASYVTQTSSITGAIKIKFPPASLNSSSMMRLTVKIYEYAGGSAGSSRTLEIGGYNYSAGGWINFFAHQETMGGGEINVRFGQDATSDCVWIANTNTVWSYPQVFVTDVQVGYSGYSTSTWSNGWAVSFVTAFDTVEQGPIIAGKPINTQNYNNYSPTLTGVGATGTWNINIAGGSVNATNATNATNTRYVQSPDGNRDANNADKYPNAWQRGLRLDFVGAASASVNGNYAGLMTYIPWDGTTGSTGDASYQLAFGGSAVNGGGVPKLNIRKGIDTTWNSWYQIHHDGIADAYATASFRAPIFYDSNNTSYYIDAASTSVLNILTANGATVNGDLRIGPTPGDPNAYIRTQTIPAGDPNVGNEATELILFHSNDPANGSGPDYITLRSPGLRLQTYNNAAVADPSNVAGSNNRLIVAPTGEVTIGVNIRSPIYYDSNDTAYYVDPASTSVFNQLTVGGNYVQVKTHSGSDFPNGTLVTTNIPATAANGASFVLEGTGKSYSSNPPFSFMVQGYLYSSTIIGYSGIHNGYAGFSTMKIFENGGFLCFWWPRVSYWNSFEVRVRDAGGDPRNTITSITDSTEPTGTKKVTVTMFVSATYDLNANVGSLYSTILYDSNNTGYYVDPNSTSRMGTVNADLLRSYTNIYTDGNYGYGHVGLYSASRYQGVFAMGDAYKLAADGTTTGTLYGIAWSHPNAGGVAANLNTHGALIMENGTFLAALSGSIRCRDDMRAPIFYDSNDTNYYVNPNGTSVLSTLYHNAGTAYFRGGQGVDQCCGDDGAISVGGNATKPPRIAWHYAGVMEGTIEGSGSGWRKIYFYDQQGSGLGVHATGQIASNNNVVAYYSDRRLKTDFDQVTDHWNVINNLTGYRFTWNEKAGEIPGFVENVGKREVGLIAQDVLAVYPEAVYTRTEGPTDDPYKTILHDRFTPVFVEALKDLKAEIEQLKLEIKELRGNK